MARSAPGGSPRVFLAGLVIGLLVTLAAAPPAAATTAVRLSDEALVQGSDLIIHGDCAEVRSTWVGRDLVTVATVRVEDALKGGNSSALVDVVLPGGVDTDGLYPIAVTWPGAPTMIHGEEVLLFLNRYDGIDGAFAIAGWSQGKFSVVSSPDGEKQVQRNLSKVTLDNGQSRARGQVRSERLDDFMDRVRDMMAGQEVVR